MKCQKCGYENIDSATVCAMCGTPLKKKTQDRSYIIILLILCIAVGGVIVKSNYKFNKNNRVRIVDRTKLDQCAQFFTADPEISDFTIITFGSTTQVSEPPVVYYIENEKSLYFSCMDLSTYGHDFGFSVNSDDYTLSYIKGTTIGLLKDTIPNSGYCCIDVFDLRDYRYIISIGYNPETVQGTITTYDYDSDFIDQKDISFSNEEELSSILSDIEYLEVKDGGVVLADEYADQEKEVTLTPIDENTINDLYNGNYENYIS